VLFSRPDIIGRSNLIGLLPVLCQLSARCGLPELEFIKVLKTRSKNVFQVSLSNKNKDCHISRISAIFAPLEGGRNKKWKENLPKREAKVVVSGR
jgi:hypothetical protein